jgi:hypothetical protein
VLPAALRARTDAEIARPSESLHAFYERVAAREGLAIGTAVEHAQCVCRALAELLDDDTRARLARALPDALDALLARPEAPAPRPPHTAHHSPPSPHDLAAGRPGSRQPLADAAPHSAHTHSLARSDAPHADTKLSSSSGTTQEREAETLAQGHPGSERPLGEG